MVAAMTELNVVYLAVIAVTKKRSSHLPSCTCKREYTIFAVYKDSIDGSSNDRIKCGVSCCHCSNQKKEFTPTFMYFKREYTIFAVYKDSIDGSSVTELNVCVSCNLSNDNRAVQT